MTVAMVAIIGSFRKHYGLVLEVGDVFEDFGIKVNSPSLSVVANPGEEFVRFETDDPELTDQELQELTMERILESDLVYTVAPQGYVGRGTCYEIGRVHERGIPIYYSERPRDLPISIPESRIIGARELATLICGGTS